jgi:hypothetical protein
MKFITGKIEHLLLNRGIYDSLDPLVEICSNINNFFILLNEIQIKSKFKTWDRYRALGAVAHVINVHPSNEHSVTFTPNENQESFRKFIQSWNRLNLKNIPFEDWSDLAEEGITLLKTLIDENKLERFKDDQRYKDFMKRFIQRHEDLRLSGKYPDLNELMDD